MRRRWTIWRGNPNANVRLAQVAVTGAMTAGAISGGDSSLLNIVALVCVAASAWFEGRYADAVAEYWPVPVRRGTLLRMGLGFALLIGGWVGPAKNERLGSASRNAISGGALFGGLGLISGASARFVLSDLARYASRKLQERLDDDF